MKVSLRKEDVLKPEIQAQMFGGAGSESFEL